jgi:hypothetical protein
MTIIDEQQLNEVQIKGRAIPMCENTEGVIISIS